MEYLKVTWTHDFNDEPVVIFSELNENRLEIRKIEVYRDNSFGIASKVNEFGGTALSLEPVPTVQDIMEDPQFLPVEIDKVEFEELWEKYIFFLSKA